jgi:hypothetical protein
MIMVFEKIMIVVVLVEMIVLFWLDMEFYVC